MKRMVFILIIVAISSCNKSKKIAPNLKIEKVSEFPICGFHDVLVFDVKSKIVLDSTFFTYPNSKYLYKGLYYGYPNNRDHQVIKWKKVSTSDSTIIEKINFVNEECDVAYFKESSTTEKDALFYSGITILDKDDYFQGLLLLNVKTNKLFVFENYDKQIQW